MKRKYRTATKTGKARTTTALIVGVCMAAFAPLAFAAPGGGGGGVGGGGASASRTSKSTKKNIDPAESFQKGTEAYNAGEYAKADKHFRNVLSVSRDHPETNYYMGLTKIKRDKVKSSRRYFERAIKARPSYVEAREQLAMVHVYLEDPEAAAEQLDGLKQILADCETNGCGDDRKTFIGEAIARVEAGLSGAPTEEVSDLGAVGDVAMLLQPRDAGAAQYQTAIRFINEERFEEAIDELNQASGVIGPHADVLNYLGYSHRKLMRFEEAEKYYRQALAIDPAHLGANEYLGEMYLELGDLDKAKEQLAVLDELCAFACIEREDLARLIAIKESVRRAGN